MKGFPKYLLKKNKELSDWSIITAYMGSISHGLYVPKVTDDKDVMCVIIPPKKYYYGLEEFGSRGTKEIKDKKWDIVIYEFFKFIKLLMKSNPNVLGLLWLEKENYINVSDEGDLLIKKRKLFVTKQAYHSFVGYAHDQLYKMTHQAYQGYMGEKRKSLVKKFGYDTKNASHLIRLLRMGIEFLVEGKLYVKRKDGQDLLAIKRGEWSLEKVERTAHDLFKKAELAYIHSKLPNKLNRDKINELCIDILENRFFRWGVKTYTEEAE